MAEEYPSSPPAKVNKLSGESPNKDLWRANAFAQVEPNGTCLVSTQPGLVLIP